ncbi:AMP-binding protein [Streptomyces monticola]|uniref:AMP-binding protein n=1 Tax=Streptomyces monticola TaxID=2666263 RepID=A0ABW2JDT2_9ACTN
MTELAETLHTSLDETARRLPDTPVEFRLDRSERRQLTARELVDRSRTGAAALLAAGARPADRVGLLCLNEPDFLVGLFSAVRLGCAVCPLPLPTGLRDIDGYLARIGRVAEVAGMSHLVLSASFDRFADALCAALPGVTVVPADALAAGSGDVQLPVVAPDAPAIVQFTSGSTAAPKGVVLSHRNVLACVEAMCLAIEVGPRDSYGMWLPLFHDMGLFSTLGAVYSGIPAMLWQPTAFVKKPGQWLREFAESRATISAGPNFGYDYLTAAVSDEEAAEMDLRHWRVAFNGAETIRHSSVSAFLRRFAHAGLREGTLMSVYGLAEATLSVTFPPLGRAPRWDWVDRDRLAGQGLAVPARPGLRGTRAVASVGRPVKGMEVLVAEPGSTVPLPDATVGEIHIRGASVTSGYLTADGDSGAATEDGWLPTGDLGYWRDGELHITGRHKEMITVRGANFYPQDVEDLAQSVPGVYKQRCVAYVDGAADGDERIVLAAESGMADENACRELERELRRRIVAELGLEAVTVHVVAPRTLPRTTSGKFQRLAAKDALAAASA